MHSSRFAAVSGSAVAALTLLVGCGSAGTTSAPSSQTLTSSSGTASMGSAMGSASTSSSASSSASLDPARAGDVMFAQMMIPHHQQAVEMADLAIDNPTASAQVKGLAKKIKAAQAPEITLMTTWLKGWGAAVPKPGDDMAGMGHAMPGLMTDQQMSELMASDGRAFDKTWLTMMITHHNGAVTMAKDVLKSTQDGAVRTLANAIISSQSAEMATMTGMLP